MIVEDQTRNNVIGEYIGKRGHCQYFAEYNLDKPAYISPEKQEITGDC
jgi:hypothetical protein